MSKKVTLVFLAATLLAGCAVKIDTSMSYVPEEGGTTFAKITNEENEQLIVPNIGYDGSRLNWWANPYFAITQDGERLAYQASHNGRTNIFVKQLTARSVSQQRTFSNHARDMAFSPDGERLAFAQLGNYNYSAIYLTSAVQGTVVQQVSPTNVYDYGPHFSPDGKLIFFTRQEGYTFSIWSYNLETGTFSNYCYGLSPMPINDEEFLCARRNSFNNYEIWRVNYVKGTESIILSQEDRSFTTPSLSPDGQWILCTSNTPKRPGLHENTDIYVVRTDGSRLTQLTYHEGHDLSPVWAPDGKSIYFLSQRGSEKGIYNIWKMNFDLK